MEVTLSNKQSYANAVADVSSFFLFEASADSDSVLGDRDSAFFGDDDAESCSWDSSDQWPSLNFGEDEDDDDDDDDEDARVIDQEYRSVRDRDDREEVDRGYRTDDPLWNNNGGEIGRPRIDRRKSSVSVESTTKELESLSEVEKNRLFWEACLAS